jgi:DNA-binding SARP family transcriptional activator
MTSGGVPRLQTLGRLTLLRADGTEDRELTTRKRKLVLLTALALSQRPWTRDALLDLFWGEQAEERARHSLSDALSHLRRVLGPDAITMRRSEVALGDAFELEIDVTDMQSFARERRWDQVVAVYNGQFLSGVHVGGSPRLEQWIDTERLRLDGIFAAGAKEECARLQRDGAFDSCATLAARWLEIAPTSPHAALFRIRAIAADRSPESDQRAIEEFARIERRLAAEYGVRPDRTVVEVADSIAARIRERQAPTLDVQTESASIAIAESSTAQSATVAPTAPAALQPTTDRDADAIATPFAPDVSVSPGESASDRTQTALRESAARAVPRRHPFAARAIAMLSMAAVPAILMLRSRISSAPPSASQPAERPLTDSPQALALFQRGVASYERDGNSQQAILLLDSAIALDSTFAMAYRRLASILANGVDSRDRTVTLLTKAVKHSDRLPTEERLMTLGSYHTLVTGNYGEAASAYRALLELSPNHARAWSSLGVVYDYLGDRRRAVDAYERGLRLNPKRATIWMNLVDGRYALGDSGGAWRALDSLALTFPGHPGLFMRTAALAHAEDDRDRVESQLRSLIASSPGDAYHRSVGEMLLAKALWSWGRVEEGDAARRRSVALDRQRKANESAPVGELDLAMSAAWLRRDTTEAISRITAALRRTPIVSLPSQDRPYLALVMALASSGDRGGARSALEAYVRESDSVVRRLQMPQEHQARGLLALRERRTRDAITELRRVPDATCTVCGLPELGLAYEQLGRPDSAQLTYRRYLSLHSERRLDMTDAFHGARIREAVQLTPADGKR